MPSAHATTTKALVATNLRRARAACGATQSQVADATGATQDQISRWERGKIFPSVEWTQPLADFYFDGDLTRLYETGGPD